MVTRKTARQSGAQRRQTILNAAAAAFAARGYHATTMREIALAAGITKPVLYDHFASKQQLFITLIESARDELTAGSARAMRRNAAWIEPTLVSEWARLMRDYAKGQDRQLDEETVIRSMQWADPERDVSQARQVAISILEHTGLRCVWTDQPLNRQTLDIDHMFPWTAWPCSDLWNLLPAHRHVNQRLKRDSLPSASTMSRSEPRITDWWEGAYLRRAETPLPMQFMQEARASLPGFSTGSSGDVFSAVCLQRIRLHHDQQVPEWDIAS